MNFTSLLIGAGTLVYMLYSQKQQEAANEKLREEIEANQDANNAAFYQLREDLDKSLSDNKGIILGDGSIKVKFNVKVSSVISKSWNMGGSVTLTNGTSSNKVISGIVLDWDYNGHQCTWYMWNSGKWTLKANSSITIDLHSVFNKVVVDSKDSRNAIKDALKQKSTWTASVGSKVKVTGRVLILQKPEGFTTNYGVIIPEKYCSGELLYHSYGLTFPDASTKNAADIDEFSDYNFIDTSKY